MSVANIEPEQNQEEEGVWKCPPMDMKMGFGPRGGQKFEKGNR